MHEDLLLMKLRTENAQAAWEELVELVGDRLFRAACLLCTNESDAENIVQETFFRFAKSLPRFRGDAALYTWMYGILLNVVRQQRRDRARLLFTEDPPEEESVPSDAGVTLDEAIIAQTLDRALHKLSPEHRMVLVLRYYDQMPVQDIALRLGCSVGTVKSRLFHARQQMSVLVPQSLNQFSP